MDAKNIEHMNNFANAIEKEAEETRKQHNQIVRKAHARAGMAVGLGFLGCMAQLGGMGSAIYIFFDWNTVEPFTWMF